MSDRYDHNRMRTYRDRERGPRDGDWVHDKYTTHSPRRGRSRSPVRMSLDSYRPSGHSAPRGPAHSIQDALLSRPSQPIILPRGPARSTWDVQRPQPIPPARQTRHGDGYRTIESLMEGKAIKDNIRKPFFQHLNRARHEACSKHKDCDYQIRAYLADKSTWDKFWPLEKFPAKEPSLANLPTAGHSQKCWARFRGQPPTLFGQSSDSVVGEQSRKSSRAINAGPNQHSSGLTTVKQEDPSPNRAQFSASTANLNFSTPSQSAGGLSQTAPSPQLLYALLNAQSVQKCRGTIIMIGTRSLVFPEPAFVYATFLSWESETFEAMAQVGYGLRCHLFYHRVATGDLLLWVSPTVPTDIIALSAGQAFLEGWLERIQRFGQVRPSIYWNEIQAGNLPRLLGTPAHPLSNRTTMSAPPVLSASASNPLTLSAPSIASVSLPNSTIMSTPQVVPTPLSKSTSISDTSVVSAPMSILAPHNEKSDPWAEYKKAFKPSEIEILLVEETAKVEGMLRLVLDQVTGEVITLRELLKRAVHRSL